MGHFGDRVGRKSMLVLSLMLMGVSTFLVGLLPTYAQVGIWAPVLLVLLRFVQAPAPPMARSALTTEGRT